MNKIEVTDAMVRRCKNVSILMDKKMCERRIEHDEYIIMLDENVPFSKDEQVKIMRKSDFENLQKHGKNTYCNRSSWIKEAKTNKNNVRMNTNKKRFK